ncbi:MAG: SIS domain-containing protein [Actinobacteria bacterium]|nr:SIS domain-containing protein [Actinomycetota bacterium]
MTDVLDTLGIFDATASLPEQVVAAAERTRGTAGLPDREDIENVVVLGMGGSGIAGDILLATAAPFMPVPVVVVKSYIPPAFVSDTSLVFAISFSGDTEETVEAAAEAAVQGAKVVVVSAGGELERMAESWGAAYVAVPTDGIPMPRVGLGAMAIPPLVVLEEIGLFAGATEWIELAVAQLRRRRDSLLRPNNLAIELARRLGRTIPLIHGGGAVGQTAGSRWRTQVNENAKAPAFSSTQPELCHNEICGWGQHGDVTRQLFTLVNLRHDHEHPQLSRRVELVADMMREVVAGIEEVRAEGEGELAQLLDLILVGDFTSFHLAAQEGIDPGPIPALDEIKSRLAEERQL